VGDALGTTVEFCPRDTFEPITGIVGGGPFGLEPGQWTDDTSMALCLATSLVECRDFDARDQMTRYTRWRDDGYMSSTGVRFDIGMTTAAALQQFELTQEPFSGLTGESSAGNGSIMRLAPVPMFYLNRPQELMQRATDSSRTTHATRAAVDACRYFAGLIAGALDGVARDELLSPRFTPIPGSWTDAPLHPAIDTVAAGSFKAKTRDDIRGSGYVVESLEAALWAFHCSKTFADGALLAVNLGDDADTTGAVYGQLAGAFYGEKGIPWHWLESIARRDLITGLADQLLELA